MVDYDALQKHVQSLKPVHIECREGTLCVAIVPHGRSLDQRFTANDLMWVKCPKSKQVKVLVDAYRASKYKPKGHFLNPLHGGHRLEPFAIADILQDGDKVVVLQAIDGDAPYNDAKSNPGTYPTPSRTISAHSVSTKHTNTAAHLSSSSVPTGESRSPVDFSVGAPLTQSYSRSCSPVELAWIDFFAEALQTLEGESQAVTTRFNINDLFSEASTALYEQGVQKGLDILSSLKKVLDNAQGSPDAEQWIAMIRNLEAQAEKTRTIIGIVGATGAGKSSVINAMLDEKRLLPTNCMRVCTAVVTEISYNSRNELYRAKIEFISQAEWRKELNILYQELLDSHGNVAREAVMNEDSEAGIAYAKLKAVYPHLTKETMAQASPDRLVEHKNVRVLGTVKPLEYDNVPDFYQSLQRYIDSKEKVRKPGKGPDEAKSAELVEYWPLIKVVHLYVRSPALETGAFIVDLPGVHDFNQAREAVAQRYMKESTGLWIVAPITRAVDDKSAKTLLGETFKRQLKIDGAYNSVTSICSKTDDISLTEAIDSLQLDEKLQAAYDNIQKLTQARRQIQQQLDLHQDALDDVTNAVDRADDEVEAWEKILSKCQAGQTAYLPAQKKRKKVSSPKARKRPKYSDPDSDDDFVLSDASDESDRNEFDEDDNFENREPVTEEHALAKVEELRNAKKEGRRRKIDIENEIKALRKQAQANKQQQEASDAIISHECISGRNNYSRMAIKQDFAAGIKELDQEIAEGEDAANFDPDEDIRDYDEALEKQVQSVQTNIKEELEDNLYGVSAAAVEAAKIQENATVAKWAQPYDRNEASESGLHYSTYKAVCRRDGVYTNAFLGLLHFNEQLTEPIIKHIANGWEKTFQRRIPGILTTLVTAIDKMLHTFHDEVEKRAIKNGGNMARFHMLRHGFSNYREVVKDTTNRTKIDLSSKQRDINREFVPVITNAMMPAYDACTEERGPGSFKRMKATMEQHVDNYKSVMFAQATDTVRQLITKMLKDVQGELEASMDEIFLAMKRDYTQLVTGVSTAHEEQLPREQRKMRKEVLEVVEGARLRFERVVGTATPSPEPEEPSISPVKTEKGSDGLANEDINIGRSMFSQELHDYLDPKADQNQKDQNSTSGADADNQPMKYTNTQDGNSGFDHLFSMSSASSTRENSISNIEQAATNTNFVRQPKPSNVTSGQYDEFDPDNWADTSNVLDESHLSTLYHDGSVLGNVSTVKNMLEFSKAASAFDESTKENRILNNWLADSYGS